MDKSLKMTHDEQGKELLLKEGKFQVMMEWEKPYMEACIDALKPSGDVLEIGFGCGYSARRIQTYHPKSHTIVECDPGVAEKARQFAKAHQGVRIVEDTWQHALASLGVFDVIFFDDYPLETGAEMQRLRETSRSSSLIVEKGKQVVAEAKRALGSHLPKRYSQDDLLEFFQLVALDPTLQPRQLLVFLEELRQGGQIAEKEQVWALNEALSRKLISPADVKAFIPEKVESPFAFEEKGDRLFEFLSACLEKHMRKGSRFSCFLEDPTSKFEDKKFVDHIISNPFLDYTEKWIDIEVPANCQYYTGDKALVITITKMA
jgi:predicted O-methyltransferase YrrM